MPLMDNPEDCKKAMIAVGFPHTPEQINQTGDTRFSSNTGKLDPSGSGLITVLDNGVRFYSFSLEIGGMWYGSVTGSQSASIPQFEPNTPRKLIQLEAAVDAGIDFESARPASRFEPYPRHKRLPTAVGLRIDYQDILLVPMYLNLAYFNDIDWGETHFTLNDLSSGALPKDQPLRLVGLQRIYANSKKRFTKGAIKKGAHCWLGNPQGAERVYYAEGWATGETVHLATGCPVCVCFDCGNIKDVALSNRKLYPSAEMVFCADDDIGTHGNPGVTKATEAARLVGGKVILPKFIKHDNNTDFNDMYCELADFKEWGRNGENQALSELKDWINSQVSMAEFLVNATATPETALGSPWQAALAEHVEKMNQTFASVHLNGKHFIVKVTPKGLEFYKRDELSKLYDNTRIQTGEKSYKNHVMAWVTHPNARTYVGGIVFAPGEIVDPDTFNLWKGFAVEPKQCDELLKPIHYHMREILCGGDQERFEYLINWVAFTFQNPAKPAGTAVVFRGEKGSGKGTLAHFLKTLWGRHGLHISSSRYLVGNFNSHLQGICFLFSDEAFYSGDKAHECVLKALITEPDLMIELKGVDAFSQPNYLKILMATNSDYAVPASRDERRFFVLDVSSSRIGDSEYFDSLQMACSSKDVQAAFLHDMLNRDLTGWRSGNIPDSRGLQDQRYHSLGSAQKWLADCLVRGSFETLNNADHYWSDRMTSNDLFSRYLDYCNSSRVSVYQIISQVKLSEYLGRLYSKIKRADGKNARGFYFGPLDAAIKRFEEYEKVNISDRD